MPPQTKNLHVNNNDIKQPTTQPTSQHQRESISTPVNHTTESFEKKIIPENNHSNPFTHWYGQELKWRNIIFLAIIHVLSVIAFFTYPWTFDKATIRLFTFSKCFYNLLRFRLFQEIEFSPAVAVGRST